MTDFGVEEDYESGGGEIVGEDVEFDFWGVFELELPIDLFLALQDM